MEDSILDKSKELRKEQIWKEACEKYGYYYPGDNDIQFVNAWKAGAEWADNNPQISLTEQIEELQKALKASQTTADLSAGPALKVADNMEIAKKYLSPEALKATEKVNKTMFVTDENGKTYRSISFCVRTRTDRVEEGIKEMCQVVNRLVEQNVAHSFLALPGSSLELVRHPGEAWSAAIFCFVHVPSDMVDTIKKIEKYCVEEGAVGENLHSLDLDLKSGEFWGTHYVSGYDGYGLEKFEVSASLNKAINSYLKILPEGTQFLGANQCAISDLTIPYELKFFNPLLKKVKKVELDHVRAVEQVDENRLHQFNIFTGIRYYGHDGKRIFNG